MKEIPLSEVPKYVETFLKVRDSIKEKTVAQMQARDEELKRAIVAIDRKTVSEMSTVGAYDSKLGKWVP
jgi:hypothetical protein